MGLTDDWIVHIFTRIFRFKIKSVFFFKDLGVCTHSNNDKVKKCTTILLQLYDNSKCIMKIYYEPQDFIIKQDDELEKAIVDVDNLGIEEMRLLLKTLIGNHRILNYKLNIVQNEKMVLRAQWALRKLNEEMNFENGSIILLKGGNFKITGFSDYLSSRIKQCLLKM